MPEKTSLPTTDTQLCQLQVSKHSDCLPHLFCTSVSYYIDKSSTKELLNFILHGETNVSTISHGENRLQLAYKPPIWPFDYEITILFHDRTNKIEICTEKSHDWLNYGKQFAKNIQNKYIAVSQKG